MFIHNYSHTFFLLLRGPISQVVLHDCRQRDVSQTLMSIHGWVRGFRMCKTSSLQLLLGQLGTSVGSHPSEELENVHWSRGAWNQQHGSFLSSLPIVESLVRGWLLALVLHLAVAYTSHFIRAKSKAAAPFRMKMCWLVTLRMVRVWLVCLKQWIFLLPYWLAMHSLHIRRLAQCRGRGRACLFWGKYLFVLKQLLPTLLPSQIWHTFFSFPQSLVW